MTDSKNNNSNKVVFDEKEYDVSISKCCFAVIALVSFGGSLCAPYKTIIILDAEEVTKNDTTCCGESTSKRPYGELGSVARSNCFCCVAFHSSFGDICPGSGCSADLVDEIVDELKARQRGRGDTAQIRRQEETLERLDNVEAKLDAIMNHLNIEAPSTNVMSER